MSAVAVYLSFFSSFAFIVSGMIPLWKKSIDKRMLTFWVGLGAGLMMMLAVQELLVESLERLTSWTLLSYWLAGGLIFMYFLERFTDYHSCIHHECEDTSHKKNVNMGILLGLGIHNFNDGVLIGALGSLADVRIGYMILISIVIHQASIAISLTAILLNAMQPKKMIALSVSLIGLTILLGTLVYNFVYRFNDHIVGVVLAFCCGAFLYVAISDLIPEAHTDPRAKTPIISFILGVLLVILLGVFLPEH